MKPICLAVWLTFVFSSGLIQAARPTSAPSDFDNPRDGKSDLVWRNRITGKSQIWYMDGLDLKTNIPPRDITDTNNVVIANPSPAGGNPDLGWRIVGSGFVDEDLVPDIIWQRMDDSHLAVWYMGGAHGSVRTASYDNPLAAAPGWRLVGVGYFNDDTVLDVLWENETSPNYPKGQLAIWLMRYNSTGKTWTINTASVPPALLAPRRLNQNGVAEFEWSAVAVADFGSVGSSAVSAANPTKDGVSDILLGDKVSHTYAIWIMGGPQGDQLLAGYCVGDGVKATASEPTYRVVAAHDFGGGKVGPAGLDGKSDILFRHEDFGDSVAWLLDGSIFLRWVFLGPVDPEVPFASQSPLGSPNLPKFVPNSAWRRNYDHQWKLPNQPLPDPIERTYAVPNPSGDINVAPPRNQMIAKITGPPPYKLRWNLFTGVGGNQLKYTIRYKKSSDSNWTLLGTVLTNVSSAQSAYSFSSLPGNQPIDPTERYDFSVTLSQLDPGGKTVNGWAAQTTVAVNARPLDHRGAVLLLVDETLNNSFPAEMGAALNALTADLQGDGWKVLKETAPRHTDYVSPTVPDFKTANFDKLAGIKAKIRNAYTNGARAVLIIGHVVVPYSGNLNPDGHEFRCGPADLFYGDIDGTWADTNTNMFGGFIVGEERQNGANDGKMDESYIPAALLPSPPNPPNTRIYNGLELCVGRVDFARLAPPHDTPQAEVNLISQYFAKTRKYRHVEAPLFPLPERSISWNGGASVPAVGRFRAILGYGNPTLHVSGDSLMQRSSGYLLGYTGGNQAAHGYFALSPNGPPTLLHRYTDFLDSSRVPFVGFNLMSCSLTWDWNIPYDGVQNSVPPMLKGALMAADYSLVTIWNFLDEWVLEPLGLGEHIGACEFRNALSYAGFRTEHPDNGVAFGQLQNAPEAVYHSVIGDPTLRLYYLRRPQTATKSGTQLTWVPPVDNQTPTQYTYLVSFKDTDGFIKRVMNSQQPVPCCSLTLTPTEAASSLVMVRSVKTVTSGNGQHQALSQGTFAP